MMQNCLLLQPYQETSTARPDIGCSHQGSQPALQAALERLILCLDCVHGLHFCRILKEMSQIFSPCSHLRWIELWYMVHLNASEIWWQSTGPGMERKMPFCNKHQKDESGHCCPVFIVPHCQTSFHLYPENGRKSSTASGSIQIAEKLYKYPINNSDSLLTDTSKF